jgi:hypothetical protein
MHAMPVSPSRRSQTVTEHNVGATTLDGGRRTALVEPSGQAGLTPAGAGAVR